MSPTAVVTGGPASKESGSGRCVTVGPLLNFSIPFSHVQSEGNTGTSLKRWL